MENILKDAERFSEFLSDADKRILTLDEIMKSGFFESIEEAEVFFVEIDKNEYITTVAYEDFIDLYSTYLKRF